MDPEVTFQEAEKLFKCGKYEDAEKKYSEFIEIVQPGDHNGTDQDGHPAFRCADTLSMTYQAQLTQALNNRGQIKYLRVDFDEAIEDYTAALNVDSDFAVGYYNRGQIHYRLARFKQGIEDFNNALALQPDFPDAALALKTAIEDQEKAESPS